MEVDAWDARTQARLDAALAGHPASRHASAPARWAAIAAEVGLPARECLARFRHVRAVLRGGGGGAPEPELVLQFCQPMILGGLLPWHCRVTQYVHLGPLRSVSEEQR